MTGRPNHRQAVFAALPGTIPQIIKKSGVSRATVFAWIRVFQAERLTYIKRWKLTKGNPTPFYVIGEGENEPRPGPQTSSQYSRRYYVKHRAEFEREQRANRRAAREYAATVAKRPQSWLSALGVAV